MDRQSVLSYIYDTKLIERIASAYWSKIGELKEDYVQYIWLLVCELPEDKLVSLFNKNQLDFYIYSIARNQAWNDKSSFNKLYTEQLTKVYGEIERIIKHEEGL